MKSLEETIKYIEMELKILSLEDLIVNEADSKRDVTYKNTQIGKRIAYEKMLAFIRDEHKVNSRHLRKAAKSAREQTSSKDVSSNNVTSNNVIPNTDSGNKKPIIVCI